jgi:transposase-like protein
MAFEIKKDVEDPKFPRCKKDRNFLIKKLVQTNDGKQFWQCPKCKEIVTI